MSLEPLDPGPRPPRRNRPATDPSLKPPPLPPEAKAGPSSSRPRPAESPGTGPAKPRKARPKTDADRDPLDEKPQAGCRWARLGRADPVRPGRLGQLAQFSRQFASYLHAGIDIRRALSSLEKQFRATALGPVIGRLQESVKRGDTLEDAMAREPQAFGTMYLSMIRVAEARADCPRRSRCWHITSRRGSV